MTTTTQEMKAITAVNHDAGKAPFYKEVAIMTWRDLITTLRTPSAILPSIFINVFFLIINHATFGRSAGFLPELAGKDYLGFILPLSVISASLGGAGITGQNLVRDIESGYFNKLLLTPVSRVAIVLGPILSGAVFLAFQALIVIGLGLAMGLSVETGVLGVLALVGVAVLTGMGLSGYIVGLALRTGNSGAVQAGSFLFFPLTFITASYVPLDLLDGWLKTAARINPITYSIEAGRSLMLTGWEGDTLAKGILACGILAALTFAYAMSSLKARTARS